MGERGGGGRIGGEFDWVGIVAGVDGRVGVEVLAGKVKDFGEGVGLERYG